MKGIIFVLFSFSANFADAQVRCGAMVEAVSVAFPDEYYMSINYRTGPQNSAAVKISCVDEKLIAELSALPAAEVNTKDLKEWPASHAEPEKQISEEGVLKGSPNKSMISKVQQIELHSLKEEIDNCKIAEDKIIIRGTGGEAFSFALDRAKIEKAYKLYKDLLEGKAPAKKKKAPSKPQKTSR